MSPSEPSTTHVGVVRRLFRPIVELREGETTTALLMFAYSFLAMTAYNIVRPITRSKFIADLGADNLPWVQLAAGLLIGVIMTAYAHAISLVPRRWAIPLTQLGCVLLLVVFWVLFTVGYVWVPVAFYVLGLILGLLLISQFWTLANDIYDARHALGVFGFIGGGASLGGATGAAITATVVERVGTVDLLLVSAAVMTACLALVIFIVRRETGAGQSSIAVEAEGVGGGEAIRLLRESRHLQLIAMIIGCAAMGGVIIEQQLNMAAASNLGENADGITKFLAQVTVYLSLIGFLIQVSLTSRIHSLLGIGFALLILPVGLGTSAIVMLFNAGLWAPAIARVADASLRYTVDKTTREVLFLPLPTAVKYRAKPFIDVTMDRLAKALGALTVLVLIKPWGLGLTWQQLSFASLTLMALWVMLARRAKREYLATFRRSLAHHDVEAAGIRTLSADLQTIELLVEELAHPDERRVLHAIDLLESLERRRLITPLLLYHGSPLVRARTLRCLAALSSDVAASWLPAVERLLADEDADVRAEAVRAISTIRGPEAASLLRRHLTDSDPRMVATAAVALAAGADPGDISAATAALQALANDTRETAVPARMEVARALGDVPGSIARDLLISLMYDRNVQVAQEAVRSAGHRGRDHAFFVPPLISLLRHRLLKSDARAVLIGFGSDIVEPLAHFLKEEGEDLWVRRHLPATLARIPSQRTMDVLVDALSDRDGFLRYKAITAIEALHRSSPELVVRRDPVETLTMAESLRYFNALTLHANFVHGGDFGSDSLLVRALEEKQSRSRERVFRLLGLIYSRGDMRAAWVALERGTPAEHASAAEYLDNVLSGALRKRVVLMVDDMPIDERVRRTNLLFRTRRRTPEDTLAQLIHDDDQVIAACAIHLAAEHGISSLTDDIEYALAHRDPRDWYVFESASWALATSRMSVDDRRARWNEPLPTVELAKRLRGVPVFDYVSVDELFRFAGTARQVRYDRGRTVYDAGLVPNALQFLIDGEVRVENGARIVAPGPLAFEELLTGRPLGSAMSAVDVAVTLSLTQDEFLTLAFDNIDVAHGLFRMVLSTRGGIDLNGVTRGVMPDVVPQHSADGLQPMERALLLQASPLTAGATSAQVMRLAMIAQEVPLVLGAVVVRETDDPAIYLVVSGALRVEVPGAEPLTARTGDAVGLYETLADMRFESQVTVAEAGVALRIDDRDLFDVLAADVELLQGLFRALLTVESRARAVESATLSTSAV
jgi:ATP/ADP translocase/HEAT repeat protein/CRP-like cAMP-binding protein